jgi:hypothetical protein
MTDESKPSPLPGGQFLVYQTEDGKLKIDVRFEGETVWLTQQHMAELFQTTKQNVGQHLKNILEEGELAQESVVKDFFTTAADGKKALDSIGEFEPTHVGCYHPSSEFQIGNGPPDFGHGSPFIRTQNWRDAQTEPASVGF